MFISIFPFFLVFKNDFIRCTYFTRITASTTASDDVTNQVTHRIFYTDCSILVIILWSKLMKNLALNGGF